MAVMFLLAVAVFWFRLEADLVVLAGIGSLRNSSKTRYATLVRTAAFRALGSYLTSDSFVGRLVLQAACEMQFKWC